MQTDDERRKKKKNYNNERDHHHHHQCKKSTQCSDFSMTMIMAAGNFSLDVMLLYHFFVSLHN